MARVGLDHLVQQIELVGIELLAAAGEAVAPQHGEFVVQPLVERFQVIDALTQLRGQLAQLLGCQVIESGRTSWRRVCGIVGPSAIGHWPNCAPATGV